MTDPDEDEEWCDVEQDELLHGHRFVQLSGTWWRVCHCGERERRPGSGIVSDDWDSVERAVFGETVKAERRGMAA